MITSVLRAGLLAGLLGLSTLSVSAQTVAPAADSAAQRAPVASPTDKSKQTFKQKMLAQYASNDTARAVINLFAKRQGGGAIWIVSASLFTVRGVVAAQGAYSTTVNGVVVEERDANPTPVILVGGLFAGYGVSKLARFSNGKLEQTLQAYHQGTPLPKWVRRRLKPRFFARPRRINERR
ncbi:hypothetical protein LGH70_16940 [Hymenobacter sp. BT635]|uniref:Uncharacterized protein n=1 Tax=Hymenobacter nitidus TaxID=2880929 RepID=A0ABS8AFV0_9BACT|nr:hypothetical protein [Hymenobacter nitidus]MCB2379286.1 hypothetical protein [Hymenobacter nitidus]